MHVTASGVVVKSKNEVIVAGVLDEVAPGRWAYETPLKGADGRTVHPDFTIQRADGSVVLWEHLFALWTTSTMPASGTSSEPGRRQRVPALPGARRQGNGDLDRRHGRR